MGRGRFMLVALATRLLLIAMQGALTVNGSAAVVRALAAGAAVDAVTVLWLAVPFMIYLFLVPERIFRSRLQRWLFWPAAGRPHRLTAQTPIPTASRISLCSLRQG